MNTRDPDVTLAPEELKLVSRELPQPGHVVPTPASTPTPGATQSVIRHPGQPTLPDPTSSFSTMLAGMANELFAPAVPSAPPTSVPVESTPPTSVPFGTTPPSSTPPSAAPVSAPSAVPLSAPSAVPLSAPSAVPLSAPSAVPLSAPFSVAPSFDALVMPDAAPFDLGAIPLLDAPTAPTEPTPYWLLSPREEKPSKALDATPFQIEPVLAPELRSTSRGAFDPHAVRREFPILQERVHGRPLVWLDNAATTQKPQAVIDRLSYFYEHENSNIHRAAHTLAARATDAYESARESVRRFISAPSKNEIVFVRGTTEAINLVAQSWGRRNIGEGDEIVVSWLEHHANIVPWQMLCSEKKARLRVAPVDDRGQILLDEYEKLLGPKTKLVSFTQVSNALGTITPAAEMIALAHRYGAKVLLDGAQAVSHMPVDVQALDCDFFVFSGHKVFGPTGIGVVYGKREILESMPPWQGGGNMIQDVTFEKTVYQPPPFRFEAGTGNIADAVGLGAALDWLMRLGVTNVERYEHELLVYGTERLKTVPGLTMIGTAPNKAGVLSFVLAGKKTEEVGGMLDQEGIAVRSGHHCAQPILRRFGLEATVRASLAPYNTFEDLDALVAALMRLQSGQAHPARAS